MNDPIMKWIDATKERPPEGLQVLTIDARRPDFMEYRLDYPIDFDDEPNGFIWARRKYDEMNYVTHWMHLPDPPEIENG